MRFGSAPESERFIGLLEEYYGQPFHRGERPLVGFDAIVVPLIPLILIALVVGGAVWLSAHWTANPPPFPRGRTEQDPLVAGLVWFGPLRVLLVGAVPVLGFAGWLCGRVISPPWVPVFARSPEGLQFER